jgi:tetratricopeptide (TPR) repeat protein
VVLVNCEPFKSIACKALLINMIVLGAGLNSLPSSCGAPADMSKVLKSGYENLSQGRTEEALAFFQGKLKKYPNSGLLHLGIGKALKRLGKLGEAKQEFRTATQVEPSFADGFYELGVCMESDKEWLAAADAFQKFLQLKPDAGDRRAITDRIRYCQSQKS